MSSDSASVDASMAWKASRCWNSSSSSLPRIASLRRCSTRFGLVLKTARTVGSATPAARAMSERVVAP
jgi:hypothetical protein